MRLGEREQMLKDSLRAFVGRFADQDKVPESTLNPLSLWDMKDQCAIQSTIPGHSGLEW